MQKKERLNVQTENRSFPIGMDIKRMTRKTIIYYGIPLAVVAVVIGICAQSLFWTIYGLSKIGFSPALLVGQVLSVIAAVLLQSFLLHKKGK